MTIESFPLNPKFRRTLGFLRPQFGSACSGEDCAPSPVLNFWYYKLKKIPLDPVIMSPAGSMGFFLIFKCSDLNLNVGFKTTPEHAHPIEWHGFLIHVLAQSWIIHHFFHDLIAMFAGLVCYP